MTLRKGDRIVAMEVLAEEGEILSVAANGMGKRTAVKEYRRQGRGGKGIINLKVSKKTGEVIGVRQVREGDGMILITLEGKIIRTMVDGIRVIGRSTQGVKLMDLEGEDTLVAMAKLADRDDVDEAHEEAAAEAPAEAEEESVN